MSTRDAFSGFPRPNRKPRISGAFFITGVRIPPPLLLKRRSGGVFRLVSGAQPGTRKSFLVPGGYLGRSNLARPAPNARDPSQLDDPMSILDPTVVDRFGTREARARASRDSLAATMSRPVGPLFELVAPRITTASRSGWRKQWGQLTMLSPPLPSGTNLPVNAARGGSRSPR
jgi:hypothetical protein